MSHDPVLTVRRSGMLAALDQQVHAQVHAQVLEQIFERTLVSGSPAAAHSSD
ncbi:MAG: hypothetical protein GXP62_21575 [Oligoflexia bacterium]|nr:hypothetical protein [Oligoflexia bacterium]